MQSFANELSLPCIILLMPLSYPLIDLVHGNGSLYRPHDEHDSQLATAFGWNRLCSAHMFMVADLLSVLSSCESTAACKILTSLKMNPMNWSRLDPAARRPEKKDNRVWVEEMSPAMLACTGNFLWVNKWWTKTCLCLRLVLYVKYEVLMCNGVFAIPQLVWLLMDVWYVGASPLLFIRLMYFVHGPCYK